MTELPNAWASCLLDEINDPERPICYGILMPGPDLADGIPYVKVRNIRDEKVLVDEVHRTSVEIESKFARSRLRTGDVLVSIRGTYGRTATVPAELDGGNITQDTARVAPVGAESEYVRLFMQSPAAQDYFKAVARGVAVKGVNIRDLRKLPVPIAPVAEQTRIVGAIEEGISKLDAGEAGLRTVRQLLKRMRAAVYAAAVTGHLVPQRPTDTPASKLLVDLGIATSANRAAPPGWASAQLGDLSSVTSGPAFKSSQFGGPGDGIRLLRGENIEPGSLRWRDTRTWPTNLLDGYEHLLVDVSDLILAMDRPVISTGLKLAEVRPDDLPALLVQRVARIRPVTDELGKYLWLVMQDRRFIAHLLGGQVGTQLPHITLRAIREYELAVPGPDELPRLLAEADRQLSFVEVCECAVEGALARTLATRRSVLKAAFEGRLVPQDPSDEPASVLLDRIRAERAVAPKAARRSRRTA